MGVLKESWTFVLSMNCERANELFQPLGTAFTDIPQRLHTQITCTMEAARRAWASQRSLAPNTSAYNQDGVGEKVGVWGGLLEVKCFIIVCNAVVKERGGKGKKQGGKRAWGNWPPYGERPRWRKTERKRRERERERGTWGGPALAFCSPAQSKKGT